MKIAIMGAAGAVGKHIVDEALSRGHDVTGIARKEAQSNGFPKGVRGKVADISNPQEVTSTAKAQDVVISAVRPPEGQEASLVAMTRSLLEGTLAAGVRLILVGGAARLQLPDGSGETVLSAPGFLPESVVAIAKACQEQYELCMAETRADWTYVSPAAMLEPGERTGTYRLGGDTLVTDTSGVSRISMADLAVALLDEAETPRHRRQAFTLGY